MFVAGSAAVVFVVVMFIVVCLSLAVWLSCFLLFVCRACRWQCECHFYCCLSIIGSVAVMFVICLSLTVQLSCLLLSCLLLFVCR